MNPAIAAVAILSLVAVPGAVRGQSRVTFVPSLSISSIYDDNVFGRRVGSGDQMTQLSPSFEGGYETSRTMLGGLYSFDMQRSLVHSGLNNLEARRHAMFDGRFRGTPRLTLTMVGRYDRTETAGELNFSSGLLFDRQRALRWEINPSVGYQISPRLTINSLYDLVRENIDGEAAAHEHTVRFGSTRVTSARGTLGMTYLGRHFINGADTRIVPARDPVVIQADDPLPATAALAAESFLRETHTSSAILLASSYRMTPSIMFTMQAGPRLSSRGTLEPEVVIAIARRPANYVGFGFDVWRGESIILGVRGPVEILSTTGRLVWPVRQKLEVGARGGMFDSTTLSQGRARVYHAEGGLSWSSAEPFILGVSYGADFQRGDIRTQLLSDREVVRRIIQVRLTVAPRLSRSFQPDDPLRPLGDPARGVQR
jgi:hypothetical protein